MKARIKETGEIFNIAEDAKIKLGQCDPWGNPIEMKPEDIELIQEVSEDEHWQDVRERAAIAALNGMLADSTCDASMELMVKGAIKFADELVKLLKGE